MKAIDVNHHIIKPPHVIIPSAAHHIMDVMMMGYFYDGAFQILNDICKYMPSAWPRCLLHGSSDGATTVAALIMHSSLPSPPAVWIDVAR